MGNLGGSPGRSNLSIGFTGEPPEELGLMRSYSFDSGPLSSGYQSDILQPPRGANLVSVLMAHRDVYEEVGNLFEKQGLSLNIRMAERELEIHKRGKGVSYPYPYLFASDTFQRVVFYTTAMRTSRGATLLLEEPEAHAFPYYAKVLAEDIGMDPNRNQYFLTTHNPYFLYPLIEKTPEQELAVFVVYMRNYETAVTKLTPEQISKFDLSREDVFWNLENYEPQRGISRV